MNILNRSSTFNEGQLLLSQTTYFKPRGRVSDKRLLEIKKLYPKFQDATLLQKVDLSLQNAILTAKKPIFGLTRRSIQTLLKTDKNWNSPTTFSDRDYKKVLAYLTQPKVGLLQQIATISLKNKEIYLYKVVDAELLAQLPPLDEKKEIEKIQNSLMPKNEHPNDSDSEPTETAKKELSEPTNLDWPYVYEVETFEGFTGLIQEELDYFEHSNNLPRLGAVALELTQIDFESNPDLKPIVQAYLKLVAVKIPEISTMLEAAIAA